MTQPCYFISSGEYSGDLIAAELVLALRDLRPDWQAIGMVGPAMRRAGVEELADQKPLMVMGLMEVAQKLGKLRRVESFLLAAIDARKPDIAILVDYPKFHMRLAEQLRLRGIPVIQYVAPKVWAWGESRVAALRRDFAMILGILPFEQDFFLDREVNYRYVGSPLKERIQAVRTERRDFDVEGDEKMVGLFPGSRVSEIRKILPRFLSIVQLMQRQHPSLRFFMPLAPSISWEELEDVLESIVWWKHPCRDLAEGRRSWGPLEVVHGQSLELMKVADMALVASGTATLECALMRTPMLVVYVMNAITYDIAKKVVRVPYASLVNLIAGYELVKEYLQDFSDAEVASHALSLIGDSVEKEKMLTAFQNMYAQLEGNAAQNAARVICDRFPSHLRSSS